MADSYFLQMYHKIRVTLMLSPALFSHRQRSNLDSTTVVLKREAALQLKKLGLGGMSEKLLLTWGTGFFTVAVL